MRSVGIPIPALDPPWPDALRIAVVRGGEAPLGWRRFAHDVAAVAQYGGHSFPLTEPVGPDGAEHDRTAFLYRHADRACGYLCLASRLITGFRSYLTGYRQAANPERIISPCIMIVWVDAQLRRRGVARQLVEEAARYVGIAPSNLAWAEPFTDSGYLLAHSMAPDGVWIADYG